MDKIKTDLPTFIKQIMAAKGLSYRDIEAMSGEAISHGYVYSLVRGINKSPTIDKIKALSKGLGVSEDILIKIVKGIPLDEKDDPAFLVAEEAIRESGVKLTKEEKKRVVDMVRKNLKSLVEYAVTVVKAKGA